MTIVNVDQLQVLAHWDPKQGWDDPEPDDLVDHIVADTFRLEAGRNIVSGDVLDIPRSSLSFRLRNDDGRFSPLNADSPFNQSPKSLAVGRPVLVQLRVPDTQRPDVPLAPAVWPENGQLYVTWDEPDLHGHVLTGYELRHRRVGSGAWSLHADRSSARTRTVASLANNNSYEVQVRTVTSAGAGAWSGAGLGALLSEATAAPGRPRFTIVEPRPGGVYLAWAHANDGQPVSGYNLQYNTDADPSWTDHDLPARSLSTTITGLRESVTYLFRIRAVNAHGEGPWHEFTVTTKAVPIPVLPEAPTVTLYDDPEQLTVLWTEPADGGAAIAAFGVLVKCCHPPAPMLFTARRRNR